MHLLLLPGMDGTGAMFGPFLPALPAWLQPLVVTYPPHTPLGYRELLRLVRDAAPAGSDYIVLGESFSGPLALMLAAESPPGLRGVVLCASFARCPLPGPLRWGLRLARPWWFRTAPTFLTLRVLLGRHSRGEVGRLLESALSRVHPAVMAARARAIAGVDVSAELRACPVPLLYLAAREDRVVGPAALEFLRRVRPGVEAVTVGGPHLLLQTAPAESARAIESFALRLRP